jgi:hypothetical protein
MTELPEPGRSGDLKIEPPTTAVVPQAWSGMLPSVLQAPLIAQTYSSCPVAYLVRPAASYVPAPISNQALVKLEPTSGSKEPAGGSVRRGLAFDRRGVGGPLQLPVASASGPIAPTPPPLANGDGHLKSVPWWALTTTSSPAPAVPIAMPIEGVPVAGKGIDIAGKGMPAVAGAPVCSLEASRSAPSASSPFCMLEDEDLQDLISWDHSQASSRTADLAPAGSSQASPTADLVSACDDARAGEDAALEYAPSSGQPSLPSPADAPYDDWPGSGAVEGQPAYHPVGVVPAATMQSQPPSPPLSPPPNQPASHTPVERRQTPQANHHLFVLAGAVLVALAIYGLGTMPTPGEHLSHSAQDIAQSAGAAPCPVGWMPGPLEVSNGSARCYRTLGDLATHDECVQRCSAGEYHGSLACIESEEENNFLQASLLNGAPRL